MSQYSGGLGYGNVQFIEDQIQHLDNQSFAALRNWFIEYEHARWDRQIATDSEAGKLDFLIDEALAEHHAGKPVKIHQPQWQ